jgi:hypothetical protein
MARVSCSLVLLIVLVVSGQSGWNVVDAQTNPHDYFNQLVGRPEHYRSYSLRDPRQLDIRNNGGYAQCNSCPLAITYDPANDPDPRRQDAAKAVVPAGRPSLPNQLYLPMNLTNGATYLITWDAWWGAEWDYDITGIGTYKTFQIANPSGTASSCPGDYRWLEVQHRFNQVGGNDIAKLTARSYWPAADPVPSVGSFTVKPQRWTRYWALVDRTNSSTSYVSVWAADEQTDPVQLVNRFAKSPCSSNTDFWVEMNTSSTVSPPMRVAYLRNMAVLRNVASPTSIMQRPNAGTALPPPPTPTAPSAPRNLRIISPASGS